ncbi:hypothetical protein ACG33_12145 [Steroidobacter denitrificans]|uniref:Uncharacterized protein n=1 Tax=Steroidobacter denitrificans TaxID=465721 RepID=A0A127FDS7_STEDE|nr:hypothetical protein [Steroidobacter denitrificans]AMN47835.1 hypothetical protein ACG33_12145 [Steroidobacter denitrificans]
MRVRFSEQAMRCRVSRLELDRLLSGGAVTLKVALPQKHSFSLSVRPAAAVIGEWQLDSDPTGLWLTIPRDALTSLARSPPSKEGIEHAFELSDSGTPGGGHIVVSFDVDLKDGARSPGSRYRGDIADLPSGS